MTMIEALRYTLERIQVDNSIYEHTNCRVSAAAWISDLAGEINSALTVAETTAVNQRTGQALIELAATALLAACTLNTGPHGPWQE